MTDLRPFDLLLGELSGQLPPGHLERVRVVLQSWAGQQLRVPASRRWLIDTAQHAAHRMLAQGVAAPVMRDRLISLGVSRATAYNLIGRARKAVQYAV